jgi:hypothetical protein
MTANINKMVFSWLFGLSRFLAEFRFGREPCHVYGGVMHGSIERRAAQQ